jgi:hypothetical protein
MGAGRQTGKADQRRWPRHAPIVVLIALFAACTRRGSPHESPPAAAPWKPSDPATCIDPETPEEVEAREQTDALREAATQELTTLARCAKALPASEDAAARLVLDIGSDGSIGHVWVAASTLTDCRPLECVRTALVGRRLPVSPSKSPYKHFLTVALRRGSVSYADDMKFAPTPAPDTSKTCADPGTPPVEGRLPPAAIQSIVRSNYRTFRKCYDSGLARNPNLEGRLNVRFVINAYGKVTLPRIAENTLPDCDMARCVRDNFLPLLFPKPQGGIVTVVYPIMFSPG